MADDPADDAGNTGDVDDQQQQTDQQQDGADEQQLGDAGRRALEREREARRAEAERRRALEAELATLREQQLPDAERALAAARREGADEARAELTKSLGRRLVEAEVLAAAAGKLVDPEAAVRFLELDELVNDDLSVDRKAVAGALDELLKAKPYLAATGTRRAPGSADQGPRETAPATGAAFVNDQLRRAIAGRGAR